MFVTMACMVPPSHFDMLLIKIRDADSTLIVAQLLFLEAEDSTKPIHLYINSPGGSVTAGLAIYDTVGRCSSRPHVKSKLNCPDTGGKSRQNYPSMLPLIF